MAPTAPKTETIAQWMGFDSNQRELLPPAAWPDSLNVVVLPNGQACALRSPANFNDATSLNEKVLSAAFYDRAAGGVILFDITCAAAISTLSTTGTSNATRRNGQAAGARFQSLNVNDRLFRLNGTEFIQYVTSLSAYAVGITAPAAAPTVSFVAGGSGSLATGVTVSYAYVNTTTGDVGEASTASSSTGASASNLTLRVAVTASVQTGVDKIVLFIAQDGGSVRYLYTDTNGDPVLHNNTTGNIDISLALLTNLNFFVEETVFNAPPTAGATFMFSWKNRIVLCGFSAATTRQQLQYSGFDKIFYGTPWAAWPPNNIVAIPSKSERARCGVETAVGALILSEKNSYLMTGAPTDKLDTGENTLQPSEQVRQLGWGIGTRSPLTLKNTPYGTIWLDQNKKLRFWAYSGQPREIAAGLRSELEDILDTDEARAMAEAEWFPSGKDGGFYVLTASTSGSTNNRLWVVSLIDTAQGLVIAAAPSTIAAQCLVRATLSGADRMFIGITDRLREILDFDLEGAGWGSDEIYFEFVANNASLYSTLHAIRYDGQNAGEVTVEAETTDDTGATLTTNLAPQYRGGSYSAVVNKNGTRQTVRMNFPTDDALRVEIANMRIITAQKKRAV